MMGVVVLILKIIFIVPVFIIFLLSKLLSNIILLGGALVAALMALGARILAGFVTFILLIALLSCFFEKDGIGFIKEHWFAMLVIYVTAAILNVLAVSFEVVAEAIDSAGQWLLDITCPWD